MKLPFRALSVLVALSSLTVSCAKVDDEVTFRQIFQDGTQFELSTTFQTNDPDSFAGGNLPGTEIALEDYLGVPEGSLVGKGTYDPDAVELLNYLNRWDVDIRPAGIHFRNRFSDSALPEPYTTESLPAGTFERYYFWFSTAPNTNAFDIPDLEGLSFARVSNQEFVVTLGPGYNTSISSFTIVLE